MAEEYDVNAVDDYIDESDVAVDDPSSSETAGQEPVDTRTDAEKALIAELQGLRSEVSGLKDNYNRTAQELEFYKNSGIDAEPEGDPDDFIVRNEAQEMIRRELEPAKQQLRIQELNMFESQAISKYPDYLDVVNKYGKELLDANPGMKDVILNTPNPAEAVYNYSKLHPNYLTDLQGKTQRDTVKKIQGNLSNTQTVAGSGGSAVTKPKSWATATDAEIEAKMRQLGVN